MSRVGSRVEARCENPACDSSLTHPHRILPHASDRRRHIQRRQGRTQDSLRPRHRRHGLWLGQELKYVSSECPFPLLPPSISCITLVLTPILADLFLASYKFFVTLTSTPAQLSKFTSKHVAFGQISPSPSHTETLARLSALGDGKGGTTQPVWIGSIEIVEP